MPYVRKGNKVYVKKGGGLELKGRSSSVGKAKAYLRALYANTNDIPKHAMKTPKYPGEMLDRFNKLASVESKEHGTKFAKKGHHAAKHHAKMHAHHMKLAAHHKKMMAKHAKKHHKK